MAMGSGDDSITNQHVILFLAANPRGSHELRLGEECAEIQREIKMTRYRDDFRFESRWAVSIDDLMRHLMDLEPTVVHVSGHGGGSTGLLLQDDHGCPQPVSGRALAMMVEAAGRSVRVAVLNACYSTAQAEALRAGVDCIVGMDGAIGDAAARAFAIRFYGALGNRRSIGNAVKQGIAALAARQLPDELLPRCLTRDSVDAERMFLDAPAASGANHQSRSSARSQLMIGGFLGIPAMVLGARPAAAGIASWLASAGENAPVDDRASGLDGHAELAHDHAEPAHDHAEPAHDHAEPAHDHAEPVHDHAELVHAEPVHYELTYDPGDLHDPSDLHGSHDCAGDVFSDLAGELESHGDGDDDMADPDHD